MSKIHDIFASKVKGAKTTVRAEGYSLRLEGVLTDYTQEGAGAAAAKLAAVQLADVGVSVSVRKVNGTDGGVSTRGKLESADAAEMVRAMLNVPAPRKSRGGVDPAVSPNGQGATNGQVS